MNAIRKTTLAMLVTGALLGIGWMIEQVNPGYTEYEQVMPPSAQP